MFSTNPQVINGAVTQIEHELRTIRRYATGSYGLPTAYESRSRGRIAIEEMNPVHLINAARKAVDGPVRTALCAEIGRR